MKQQKFYQLLTLLGTLFLLLIGGVQTQAQTVGLQLITRNPMPTRISDWTRDPSLIRLQVTNPANSPEHTGARVAFEVRDAKTNKIVVRSKDGDPRIPTIKVNRGPWNASFFGQDLIHQNAVDVDPALYRIALATNALPEGRYRFCIKLLDRTGNTIPTTGGCSNFSIVHPRPPTLILPNHHEVFLPGNLPSFSWTPAQHVIGSYRLRIVPVYQNQSEQHAIQTNQPLIDKNVGGSLVYQYNVNDPSFNNYFGTAYGFAWQVSITDAGSGTTYSSEVRHFTFGSNSPLIGLQNIANGAWPIKMGPKGGGGGGGGKGGGGKGGKGGKANKDLGNIGTVKSTCEKSRTFRIWMNFGNMGFNTFPMEVLEISGVNPAIADISSDGGTITVKCKSTGTFTITVKIRALRLGLAPFTDVYTAKITIDCRCGKKKGGKKKGGDKDDDDDDSKDDGKGGKGDGKDDGKGDGSGGDNDGENGDKDQGDGQDDGQDQDQDDDPCKKLKALEQAIKDAEKTAKDAADAVANSEQAKKDCDDAAKKAQDELDKLNKEIDDLRKRQNDLLQDIKQIHENDGVNFGWSYNSRTGELTYGAIVNGNFMEGIVPGAWQQVKALREINNQLKAKIAQRNAKQAEADKAKKDCDDLEKNLKEEADKKAKEAEKAKEDLEKLKQEYEQLKKDCDKKTSDESGDGSDDNSQGDDQNESGDGSGAGSGSGSNGTESGSGSTGGNTGGSGETGSGDGTTGEGSTDGNGSGDATDDDPCEKLKELEQQIAELQRKITQADAASDNISELEDAKAELEAELEKAEKALDNDWRYWEILGEMTDKAFRDHGENSDEYRSLKQNRDNYLAKIQAHQARIAELKKQLKENSERLDNARQAKDEADNARQQLQELQQEYNRLKEECDKKKDSSLGDSNGSSDNGSNGNSGAGNNGASGANGSSQNSDANNAGAGSNADKPTNGSGNQDRTVPIEIVELSLQGIEPIVVGHNNSPINLGADACNIDCSKIVASRGTAATDGMIIAGRAGSVPPNAQVTITDKNGNTATVTAGADGSFRATEADLPDGFDHTVGNQITITAGGKSCVVTIGR